MARFLLVERQSDGCDYTIGCGICVTEINADNFTEAENKVRPTLATEGEYILASAHLYLIQDSYSIDLEDLATQRQQEAEKKIAQEQLAVEQEEYKRLKSKFG